MRIGVISDTHGFFDEKLKKFLREVDEIWHAGDIGSLKLADEISAFKPLRAVYGNIDDAEVRSAYPEVLEFRAEGLKVSITHIAGYPGRYSGPRVLGILQNRPGILIAGHSHILKVIYDKANDLLFMNPGAAGVYGMHQVRTALRFNLLSGSISDMEIGEWIK
jgi:putative phosphoesterase